MGRMELVGQALQAGPCWGLVAPRTLMLQARVLGITGYMVSP